MDLQNFRQEISQIDEEILDLLQKRLNISEKIGQYKAEHNLLIFQKNRENEIFAKISQNFSDKNGIIAIWREVMNLSKRHQQHFLSASHTVKIGIQWGEGSFNHLAIQDFLEKNPDFFSWQNTEIVFLYTTEAVLEALNNGMIQFGQFAIANSIGGLVDETMSVLGAYRWHGVKNYSIFVKHSLLLNLEAKIEEIDTIMGHEQALRQCEKNLQKMFPKAKLVAGTGNLTDNASIAHALSVWKIPKNVAAVGNAILAKIYPLAVYQENIQDREDNETTFVLVSL